MFDCEEAEIISNCYIMLYWEQGIHKTHPFLLWTHVHVPAYKYNMLKISCTIVTCKRAVRYIFVHDRVVHNVPFCTLLIMALIIQ